MLSRVLLTVIAAFAAQVSILGGGAASASPAGAPGSLTGYAFDTCSAPAQEVMDAWWQESPYAGVGVYIGGSNRLCTQPELTAAWVKKQQRTGWHVLPIQVGPQASCSGYADRMSSGLAKATKQGKAEAGKAIANAKGLGIGRGSTLYYDLEDYDIGPDDCRRAALSFLSGWTKTLHAKGFGSGVYSNIAAAIESLDFADFASPGSYAMPDDIWFAWENGRASTATPDRLDSRRWDTHSRIHQYDLDVKQTFGGYALTIDKNWVDVGRGSVGSPSKPLCRSKGGQGVSVDLKGYPKLAQGKRGPAVEAVQCLLRANGFTKAPITGTYDARTAAAVEKAQKKVDLTQTGKVDRRTWVALLARGSQPLVKVGSTGDPVRRVQRALTAALGKRVVVDGALSTKTAKAVAAYQRRAGVPATGVVTTEVWNLLAGGERLAGMDDLRWVAIGLIIVAVDVRIDGVDVVTDALGWVVTLVALVSLAALHPGLRVAAVAAAVGLAAWAANPWLGVDQDAAAVAETVAQTVVVFAVCIALMHLVPDKRTAANLIRWGDLALIGVAALAARTFDGQDDAAALVIPLVLMGITVFVCFLVLLFQSARLPPPLVTASG